MQDNIKNPTRRTLLKTGAWASAISAASARKILGANNRIRVAVAGLHGRGWAHVQSYKLIPNVEIAYLCDIDENVLRKRLADAESLGIPRPQTSIDIRQVLEDKNVDAVSIATPNHWHSLMGIWAAQAGKDSYIEKPCSHNLWEGRQLAKAVEKYKVICQHGSQCRSGVAIREAMEHIRSGLIGDVYMARGICYKWRDTIGRAAPESIPAGVHYDLWTGPAPLKPFTKNRFHYNWHWIWDTGNGELGNQGIHELDLARWGLGVTFPTKVTAMGGHYLFDDDQQTPNVMTAVYEFKTPEGKSKVMNFEVRGWMTNHEAAIGTNLFPGGDESANLNRAVAPSTNPREDKKSPGKPATIGNLYYGSKGYLGIAKYDSYQSFLGLSEQPGPANKVPVVNEHFINFIECVRSRRTEDLHAPIEEGHISSTLVHLANASYRLGRTIHFDPQTESVIADPEASKLLQGSYRTPYTIPLHI